MRGGAIAVSKAIEGEPQVNRGGDETDVNISPEELVACNALSFFRTSFHDKQLRAKELAEIEPHVTEGSLEKSHGVSSTCKGVI